MADGEDFFEMLAKASTNRLEEQRSVLEVQDKPLMLNFDLLKNQVTGDALIQDNHTTFQCNYIGHSDVSLIHDKEKLCNTAVWAKCKGKSTKSANANPFSNTVKVDATGVEFTVGEKGHARVVVPLHQVACVSLCPKKPHGPLKVVAILCRASHARDGVLAPGQKEMVIHMCRLKDTRVMWQFQSAFVKALRIAFPEHHPPSPTKFPSQQPRAPEPERPSEPIRTPEYEPVVEPQRVSPTKPKAFIHKVFVKSKEQIDADDTALAEELQRQEAIAAAQKKKQEAEDAAIVKALQAEENLVNSVGDIGLDDEEMSLP